MHLWIVSMSVDLSRAFVDCVRECGSLACICVSPCGSFACICGLCAPVWISCVHLWIVSASVDLLRAFVDCVRECGSLTCICGLCARMWISHMHLWIVCASVDLSHAFVDCVHACGSLTCICGLCARVWISHMHLWIVCVSVDLLRAFVIVCVSVDLLRAFVYRPLDPSCAFLDCVHEFGTLACVCGLCAQVWISRVHLWEDLILLSLHTWVLCHSVLCLLPQITSDCCAVLSNVDTVDFPL